MFPSVVTGSYIVVDEPATPLTNSLLASIRESMSYIIIKAVKLYWVSLVSEEKKKGKDVKFLIIREKRYK